MYDQVYSKTPYAHLPLCLLASVTGLLHYSSLITVTVRSMVTVYISFITETLQWSDVHLLSKQMVPMCTFNIFCLLYNLIFNLKILFNLKIHKSCNHFLFCAKQCYSNLLQQKLWVLCFTQIRVYSGPCRVDAASLVFVPVPITVELS